MWWRWSKMHPTSWARPRNPKAKHEVTLPRRIGSNANLWAEQVWQYQVKTADLGLRAKTYLEQNGAKKVQVT